MEKVSAFKYVIKEFHEFSLPEIISRDVNLPETKKIISVIGSRRSGKTFLFYQLINSLFHENIPKDCVLYMNFEDDRLLPLKSEELNDLLEAYYELYPDNKPKQKYFFFDEIQNVPHWETFVRRIQDKEKVNISITGSSSKLLSKELATSLRGRTLAFYLFPLSFKEFLSFKHVPVDNNVFYSSSRFKIKNLFEEYIDFGGFPEVVHSPTLKRDILSNYFDMFIYKDLVERFSIRNTRILKMLCKYLITNTACIFSINSYYKSLKQETKVSKETILEYLSYLTDIGLIYLVPMFSYSLKVQQVNPSKAYCIDTGLRNAVALRFSEDKGRLAENIVFIELKRRGHDPYYWKKSKEVDFVIRERNNTITAINVSYTNTINERELDGLQEFRDTFSSEKSKMILLTKDVDEKRQGIICIPLWKWLLGQQSNEKKT